MLGFSYGDDEHTKKVLTNDSAAVDHCVNLFDCVDNGPNNDDIDANDHLMTFMKIIEKKCIWCQITDLNNS